MYADLEASTTYVLFRTVNKVLLSYWYWMHSYKLFLYNSCRIWPVSHCCLAATFMGNNASLFSAWNSLLSREIFRSFQIFVLDKCDYLSNFGASNTTRADAWGCCKQKLSMKTFCALLANQLTCSFHIKAFNKSEN